MNKKLLLILFIFTTQLFAVDEWWVYSYGNVSTIKDVLTYLAIFKDSADYQDLILIALLGGGLISVTLKYTLGSAGYTKYFIGSTFLLMVIFGTTTSVNTVNARIYEGTIPTGNNYARVDNVPLMFATTVSAFSTIGYFFTSNIEDTFSAVGDAYASDRVATSFLNVGFNGAFKMFNELASTDIATISANAQSMIDNYKAYMELCVYPIAYTYNPSAVERLLKYSQNISSDIDPASAPLKDIVSISNIQVEHEGSVETCGDLYTSFKTNYTELKDTNDDIKDFFDKTLANMSNNPSDKLGSVVSMFVGTNGSDNASKLKNFVLNTALIKQTAYSFNAYTDEVNGGTTSISGGAGVFGSSLSKGEFIAKSTTNSQFAAETLPSMQEVIRAFMYVAFPIVLIIQLVSGGIKILQNYVMALLWVELWPPAFTIMNYFVQKETTYEAIDKLTAAASDTGLDNLMAIATIDPALETIAVNSAIASNWFWMVPMLTGFLIYGSFHALMGLTGAVAANAARGADLSYQQEKQQLQSSYEAAKTAGETNALGAESFAYQNSLATRVESDSKTQGMISEFNGNINSIAGTANKMGALDASRNKGYADNGTTGNAYSSGMDKALNEQSTASKLTEMKKHGDLTDMAVKSGTLDGINNAVNIDKHSGLTTDQIYNASLQKGFNEVHYDQAIAAKEQAETPQGTEVKDWISTKAESLAYDKFTTDLATMNHVNKVSKDDFIAGKEANMDSKLGDGIGKKNASIESGGGSVIETSSNISEHKITKDAATVTGERAKALMSGVDDGNENTNFAYDYFKNQAMANSEYMKNGKLVNEHLEQDGKQIKSAFTESSYIDKVRGHVNEVNQDGNRIDITSNSRNTANWSTDSTGFLEKQALNELPTELQDAYMAGKGTAKDFISFAEGALKTTTASNFSKMIGTAVDTLRSNKQDVTFEAIQQQIQREKINKMN